MIHGPHYAAEVADLTAKGKSETHSFEQCFAEWELQTFRQVDVIRLHAASCHAGAFFRFGDENFDAVDFCAGVGGEFFVARAGIVARANIFAGTHTTG